MATKPVSQRKVAAKPSLTSRFTVEERREIHENGIAYTLPSGVDVQLRNVSPMDLLHSAGKIPDTLTPLVIDMLYEKDFNKTNDALDKFVQEPRTELAKTLEMLESIDMVCRAALIDPEQLSYLTFLDRAYIFRLAFLPAEVLSRFRRQQVGNVGGVQSGEQVQQAA